MERATRRRSSGDSPVSCCWLRAPRRSTCTAWAPLPPRAGAGALPFPALCTAPAEEEPGVFYLFEGDGRLSSLSPRAERPAGISWVASTGRPFLVADPSELAA